MIHLKLMRLSFILGCCVLFTISGLIAQNKTYENFYQRGGKLYSVGLEYVSGFDTSIEAYSFRIGYGSVLSKNLTIYGLLDLSTTNGFQVLKQDDDTQKIRAESFGTGTSFLLRWHCIRIAGIRLFIDLSGGILYTFKSFPPEGTNLNFTARPGVGLAVHLNSITKLSIGVNRFHLSNGQGFKHPQNPAFDGLGIFATVAFRGKKYN
tara:strand:+ start:4968 stop:5588 length:621 start_codon:yes stop_codon:yes gene_type:complete